MNRLLATASQSAATTLRRQHTLAIARQIPSSFVDALSHHADSDTTTTNTVSLATSIHQHDVYLQELRKHIPTLCLPAIESHPDCLFVEDTVVAIDNVAVITHIGAASRVGEVDSVKEVLGQLGMEVVDMRSNSIINSEMNKGMSGGRSDSVAHCDGGDVLYTGRHLFVGMSNRTNELGYELLREVFGSTVEVVKVPPVIQGRDVLHLKSAGEYLLCCWLYEYALVDFDLD
jgi:dimethylargininase